MLVLVLQAEESNTDKKRWSETVVVVQVVGDTHPPTFTSPTYAANRGYRRTDNNNNHNNEK